MIQSVSQGEIVHSNGFLVNNVTTNEHIDNSWTYSRNSESEKEIIQYFQMHITSYNQKRLLI